jgi:hypothetical protein
MFLRGLDLPILVYVVGGKPDFSPRSKKGVGMPIARVGWGVPGCPAEKLAGAV